MERIEELSNVREEDEQFAQGQIRGQHLLRADPGHAERAHAQDHRDRAPVEDLQTVLRHLVLPRLFRVSGEAPLLVVLARVALDQRQGGDPLVDERVDLALRLLGGHAPQPHRPRRRP